MLAWGWNDFGQATVPPGLSGMSGHCRRLETQSGAKEGRHGGRLGLERLWSGDAAGRSERVVAIAAGERSQSGAEGGRHGRRLGR